MFTISQILHCSVQCRTTKAASKHAQFCQVVLFIRNCTHPRTLFRIFMKSSSEIVKNLKLGCASFSNFSLFLQTISFKFWKEYSDIVQFHIEQFYGVIYLWRHRQWSCCGADGRAKTKWLKINNIHDASMDESFKNNNEAKRMYSWQSSSSHPWLKEVSV